MREQFSIEPIGYVKSPHKSLDNMPVQPKGAQGIEGQVVINEKLAEGLKSLDGFSHIYLLYLLHEVNEEKLTLVPFMDDKEHGVFATRSPARPNRIGMSVVEVTGVSGNVVTINGTDVLDGTPVVDIKPYIAAFDEVQQSRSGWMNKTVDEVAQRRSDSRFIS